MLKLNLGSGPNKLDGYINVDKERSAEPDVVWDLETCPWPFQSSSVDEIRASHVLEHLGQATPIFLKVMQELYRVLVPNGTVEIKVPHPRSDSYLGDPTHVRPITPHIISLCSKSSCKEFAEKGWPNTPLANYLNINFELVSTNLGLTPFWSQRHQEKQISDSDLTVAINSYYNVVDEITMVIRKLE